jgi:O-antigen/teichoic acid export membrane protein
MLLPITQVIRVVSRVMFPALSSVQGDVLRVKRIYLRAVRMVAFITFPMMAGLYAVTDLFIVTVLGEQWSAVAPVFRILCAVAIVQTLCNPVGWIYQSQGRTDWLFRWGLVASGTMIAAIVVGATFGTVEAVALAYLLANLVLFYPCIAIPGKLIGMEFREVLGSVAGILACSLLMGLLVLGAGMITPATWPPAVLLGVQITTGIVTYVGLSPVLCRSCWEEVRTLLRERGQLGIGVSTEPNGAAAAVRQVL